MQRLLSDLCIVLITIPFLFIIGTVILLLLTMCIDILIDVDIIREFVRPYLRSIFLGE